jgi:hypothetical protein
MAQTTMDGIYENGRVRLVGKPVGVKRAKLIVTFLAEAEAEETQEEPQNHAPPVPVETTRSAAETDEGYPLPLREEYKVLIHKKLHRMLTQEEAARLEAVRDDINRIDRQAESWANWDSRAQTVEQQLTSIRRELESLPDS